MLYAIAKKLSADALSSFRRRKKQHFQPAIFRSHKGDRFAVRLFGDDQMLNAAKGLRNTGFDPLSFFIRKEKMRRPNGFLPDAQKRRQALPVSLLQLVNFHFTALFLPTIGFE